MSTHERILDHIMKERYKGSCMIHKERQNVKSQVDKLKEISRRLADEIEQNRDAFPEVSKKQIDRLRYT
jgi:hypothetical protein